MYLIVIMLTFVMAVFGTAVVTYVMPKKFESKAVIQVKPSMRLGVALPHSFATEFEVMRAQLTLQLVVQNLNLTAQWGKTEEEAIDLLRTMIVTKNIRGTDLIEISVRHTDQEVARDIAREVYEAYKKRREDKERMIAEAALKELEKAVLDQSDVVEEKRKLRDSHLRGNYHVIPNSTTAPNGSIEQQIELLEQKRLSAITALAELDTLIKMIDSLGPPEALSHVANLESAGEDFKLAYQDYQQQVRLLAEMTGEGDQSERTAQQAKVESLKALSTSKLESYKNTLKLSRDSKAAALADLEKKLIELKEVAANSAILMSNIKDAQKEFETQQQLLDRMREKLNMERFTLKQPMELVVLHEEPIIAQSPISPNVALNFAFGAGAGLLLGLVITLLMKLFQSRCKRCYA